MGIIRLQLGSEMRHFGFIVNLTMLIIIIFGFCTNFLKV